MHITAANLKRLGVWADGLEPSHVTTVNSIDVPLYDTSHADELSHLPVFETYERGFYTKEECQQLGVFDETQFPSCLIVKNSYVPYLVYGFDRTELPQWRLLFLTDSYFDPKINLAIDWKLREKENEKYIDPTLFPLLTQFQQEIIKRHYGEKQSLKQIGLAINLSEPRVSQLHTLAIDKLNFEIWKREEGLL